jgi:hypothetical protein
MTVQKRIGPVVGNVTVICTPENLNGGFKKGRRIIMMTVQKRISN